MTTTKNNFSEAEIVEQEKGFSANPGHNIGYERAARMVKNYSDVNGDVETTFIGKEMIESILNQRDVAGISFFKGIDQHGAANTLLVGVDSQGNYVLNIASIDAAGQLVKQKGIVAAVRVPDPPGTPKPKPADDGWL